MDAIWASMNAPDARKDTGKQGTGRKNTETPQGDTGMGERGPTEQEKQPAPSVAETITIKRTYKFAGEIITEEKVVPKESAEAKLYLSSIEAKKAAELSDKPELKNTNLRRPLRRYSRFDPNPPELIKKSWEKQGVLAAGAEQLKGPKLNTVTKSRLDWAAYVDQEGIKDELDVHSKAKEGYLNRMEFLDRVDAKREDEKRNARMRTRG